MPSVLVVEDETVLADVIRDYLEKDGFSVTVANDGISGMDAFTNGSFDMVVLDLMLPRMSGEDLCAAVRSNSDVPIIMTTAKRTDGEIVAGLGIGADDYLVKPFNIKVLVARIKAVLRRTVPGFSDDGVIRPVPSLEIDTKSAQIRKNGETVAVTKNEFLIFSLLATNPDITFSRERIITGALGDDFRGFDRTVDVHIWNLRKKLVDSEHPGGYIQTVYGLGYRFDGEDAKDTK